jgi:hypothetical protein
MNINFLFGSGISIPSGIAKTEDITKIVLSGKIDRDKISEGYETRPNTECKGWNDFLNEKVINFVEMLYNEINYYHKSIKTKEPNYEDLYYYVKEMHDEKAKEKENLMTKNFTKYFINEYFNKYNIKCEEIFKKKFLGITDFLREAESYIKGIVVVELDKKIHKIEGLNFLKEIYDDKKIDKINIFTINHDLLLEQYFDENNIKINDGFSIEENNNGFRLWEPESYNLRDLKIRFFKIHGSIDWYRIGHNWYEEHIYKTYGNPPESNDSYPQILIGTFNKLEDYTRGIFIDLICLLNRYLDNADNLVISGYSFGDKGINSRIINWVYKSKNRRILLIDPNLKQLKENARGAINNKRDDWKNKGILKTIESGIEETTWEKIKEYLIFD